MTTNAINQHDPHQTTPEQDKPANPYLSVLLVAWLVGILVTLVLAMSTGWIGLVISAWVTATIFLAWVVVAALRWEPAHKH